MEFAAGVNEPEASAASISRQANKESSFGSSCVHCTDDIDAMCKTLEGTIVFTCKIASIMYGITDSREWKPFRRGWETTPSSWNHK